jgi:hypothetical protein
MNDKVRQGMHWTKDCDIFRHKVSPLETQNLNKNQIYQQCSSIPWYLKEYRDTLNLCYGRQESQELQGHVPNPHIETIGKTIVSIMFFYGEAMYFQSNSKLLVVF